MFGDPLDKLPVDADPGTIWRTQCDHDVAPFDICYLITAALSAFVILASALGGRNH